MPKMQSSSPIACLLLCLSAACSASDPGTPTGSKSSPTTPEPGTSSPEPAPTPTPTPSSSTGEPSSPPTGACARPLAAFTYDAKSGCHAAELTKDVLCQPDSIMCGWAGDPVILTSPKGETFYLGSSCYSFPKDWKVEYVPGGKPTCESRPAPNCDYPNRVDVYDYDEKNDCHSATSAFGFCQENHLACVWQGEPVLLTSPSGSRHYLPSSCYDFPSDWKKEFVPQGKSACTTNP